MYKWNDIINTPSILDEIKSTDYLSIECDYCKQETKQMIKYLRKHLKEGRQNKFCSSECSSLNRKTRKDVCLNCNMFLTKGQKKYCSRSCSASHAQSSRNKKYFQCLYCKNELPKKDSQKYCNNSCQMSHQNNINVENWLSGKTPGWTGKAAQLKKFVRNYLFETRGTACSSCGWDERHPIDGAVLTEIDHIDGDAHNCHPDNLRILCPNCHSMTPNHRARNSKSSRLRH